MPSYRLQLEILGLRPGNPPESVMECALAAVEENFHVDDHQIDIIAGTPRITVRFTVPDASDDEEVALASMATAAARESVDQVALVGRQWVLRRQAGRWLSVG